MNSLAVQLTLPVLVAVVGWFVVHKLNVERDTLAKRRDLRIQYLLAAYRNLTAATARDDNSPEIYRDFELAVADIQLLGTLQQIETIISLVNEHAAGNSPDFGPILELLRDDLRNEIVFEKIAEKVPNIVQFRFILKVRANE